MTAAAGITRKEFLRGLVRPSVYRTETRRKPPHDPALDALQADFPPALLNEEAVRLGLDPQSMDRETLLREILNRMQNQRGE
jgi:hypothetical protein